MVVERGPASVVRHLRQAADAVVRGPEVWRFGGFAVIEDLLADQPRARASVAGLGAGTCWVFSASESAEWIARADHGLERVAARELYASPAGVDVVAEGPAGRLTSLAVLSVEQARAVSRLARLGRGRATSPGAALLADVILALPNRLRVASERERALLADHLDALIPACLPRDGAAAPDANETDSRRIREAVVAVIAENLGSARLNVRRICSLAGVSRTSLYRAFQGEGGVANQVRAMRLQRIREDLENPSLLDEPVAAIAQRHGLHNASSFSRSFRHAYGLAPSEVRAAVLGQADAIPKT